MNNLFGRMNAIPCALAVSAPALRLPNRLLYAINHSIPFSSNGYAIRTHSLASALVKADLDGRSEYYVDCVRQERDITL